LKCINKAPKQRHIEDIGLFSNDQMIFNPIEILDEKQKEWEKSNPERAA